MLSGLWFVIIGYAAVVGLDLKTGVDLLIHTLLLVSKQCAIPGSDK